MVNAYALKLCEANWQYIGKITGAFLTLWDGESQNFRYDQLRSVFDAPKLAQLAREAGERAWTTDTEQQAVQQLLRAVDEANARREGAVKEMMRKIETVEEQERQKHSGRNIVSEVSAGPDDDPEIFAPMKRVLAGFPRLL